ncbi:MAG: BatA domain-containing protein [Pirellulaceae bacterium]|jgi:hypothetical protein|nr:BatA domain-containing protein [Pirellulaceae bacterium]
MTFVNISLAFGALACVIPIVIHLLNRNRFQVVPWGAMHLLQQAARVNRRRVRFEQLLLLLLRMALLTLLALCMAGPVLTGCNSLAGNSRSSLVVLFDNSLSMEAGGANTSHLDAAKRETARLIEHQPRGSQLLLLPLAGGRTAGSLAPTADLARAGEELSELPDGFGRADFPKALERTLQRMSQMKHAKRDLIVVSDFQSIDWDDERSARIQSLLEQIRSAPLKPTVTLLPITGAAASNVSVQAIACTPDIVGVGVELQVTAIVKNHDQTPYPALPVVFRVDGQDQDSTEIDLAGGEEARVVFRHRFDTPNSHILEITIDGDPLLNDNSRSLAVHVWDRLPVLLVDGAPSVEPLGGATGFLEVALAPFAASGQLQPTSGGAGPTDLIDARVAAASHFTADDLRDQRVAVLANAPQLNDDQLRELEEFVAAGNALLVFLGEQVDAEWYNTRLAAAGRGLLPAHLEQLSTAPAHQFGDTQQVGLGLPLDSSDAEGAAIADSHFNHPALQHFNARRSGSLAEGRVRTWYQMRPLVGRASATSLANDDSDSAEPHVLAELDNGDPLLIERDFGRGRVVVCAIDAGDQWSNLPARPFYVPLMQRLVGHLAVSLEPARNVQVGQSLAARLDANLIGEEVNVRNPSGEVAALPVSDRGGRGWIEYSRAERSGVYIVETTTRDRLHFVASTPPEESDLAQLDRSRLETLAETLDAHLATSANEFIEHDSQRRYGRELWRPLYWLLLCILFTEAVLPQWLARSTDERGATSRRGATPFPRLRTFIANIRNRSTSLP